MSAAIGPGSARSKPRVATPSASTPPSEGTSKPKRTPARSDAADGAAGASAPPRPRGSSGGDHARAGAAEANTPTPPRPSSTSDAPRAAAKQPPSSPSTSDREDAPAGHGDDSPEANPAPSSAQGASQNAPSDGPPPPAGGDGGNARTNETPPGTSASELDAAVPEAGRAAAIEAQQAAEDADEQAAYYAEHGTYVDPESNRVYAAQYDEESGDLTLTRNDDIADPDSIELEFPEEPPAPLSTNDDDYWDDPEEDGADAAGDGPGETEDVATPTPASEDSASSDAPAHSHTHGDPNEVPDDGDAPSTSQDSKKDKPAPPPFIQDETIVLHRDGTSTSTRDLALGTPGGHDLAIVEVVERDSDGHEAGSTTSYERTTAVAGGVVADTTVIERDGEDVTTTWRSDQTGAFGTRTVRSTVRVEEGGEVVSDHRTASATAGELTINDSQYTRYEDGVPVSTHVMRGAHVDDSSRVEHYDVDYDDDGIAVEIDGGAPEGDRDPLEQWIDEQLGPLEEGEVRPAFGVIRDGGPREPVEGAALVDAPVYFADIGVRTVIDGVDVFVEGDSVAASDSLQHSFDSIRESWQGMPASMQGAARTIDLLTGRSDGDRVVSAKFEGEFHAGASAGGDHMTYWNGSDANPNTTRHEYAHLTGGNGGAPDEDAWQVAMEADQELGIRADLGELDEEDVNFIEGMDPELADVLGATSYAERHLQANDNENDDWAESVMLYLSSRENGGLVQTRADDGTIRTYRFEELYPNRAAILDSYYELGPAPDVPAPAWPEESTGTGGGFGSAFAEAIAGAQAAAAASGSGG